MEVPRLLECLVVFTRNKKGIIDRCSRSHEGLEVRLLLLLLLIQVWHSIVASLLVVWIALGGRLTFLKSKRLALVRGSIFQVLPLNNSYIIHVHSIWPMLDERHEVHDGHLPWGKVAGLEGVV